MTPPTPKLLFTTSELFNGRLRSAGGGNTGFQGADNICNAAAYAAGLPGDWIAWLSTETTYAEERVLGDGPWALVGTGLTAFADRSEFSSGPQVELNRDEFGALVTSSYSDPTRSVLVWTGGYHNSRGGCDEWTSTYITTSEPLNGFAGRWDIPNSWTLAGAAGTSTDCEEIAHLYCFQQ